MSMPNSCAFFITKGIVTGLKGKTVKTPSPRLLKI
jgi:hypothetical protein